MIIRNLMAKNLVKSRKSRTFAPIKAVYYETGRILLINK